MHQTIAMPCHATVVLNQIYFSVDWLLNRMECGQSVLTDLTKMTTTTTTIKIVEISIHILLAGGKRMIDENQN